ncbi:unnamed protein product [Nippostrongylus brasiliensis]|uniref:Uncharacterized protein n=1 Tax=Nippostrongylus brasiliensis TaxID=27835 RepID=A0A0N4Y5E4_NIPBR|nr:unnamed protein product [Nippostrongylus brasiliensis]
MSSGGAKAHRPNHGQEEEIPQESSSCNDSSEEFHLKENFEKNDPSSRGFKRKRTVVECSPGELECTVDFSSENSTRKLKKTKHSLMITISGLQNDYVNDYENLYENMPDEEVKSEQSYGRLEIDDHRNDHISAEQYDTILSSRTNSAEYSYEYPNYYSRQYKYENVDRPNSDTHYYHEESFIDENKQDCRYVIAPESPPQNLHRFSSPLAARDKHFPIFMERSAQRHPLFGNSRSAYSPTRVHARGFLNSKVYMDGCKHENAEDHDEMMVMMRTLQRLGRFMELLRCQADNFNLSRCISSKEQQIAMLNDVRMCDEEVRAAEKRRLEKEIASLKSMVVKLKAELRSAHSVAQNYREKLIAKNNKITQIKVENKHLQEQLEKIRDENENLSLKIELYELHSTFMKNCIDSRRNYLEDEIKILRNTLVQRTRDLAVSLNENSKLKSKLEAAKKQRDTLLASASELHENNARLEEELKGVYSLVEKLREERCGREQSENDPVNLGTSEVERDPLRSGYSGLPKKMPLAEDHESFHENVNYPKQPLDFEAETFATYKYNGIGKRRWKRSEHRDVAAVNWKEPSKRFWRNQRMARLLDEKSRALKQECEDYHEGVCKRHICH